MPLPRGVILGIEISNPSARTQHAPWAPGVALARVADAVPVLLAFEPLAGQSPHDDDLLPAVARLCRAGDVRPADLAGVAVSVGPGGFTALRISVAAGAMIAEATGARCFAVPTAHVVARRAAQSAPFAVALASKGDSAWIQVFERADRPRAPGGICTPDALASLGVARLVADHYLPDAMRTRAASLGIVIEPPAFDALACIEAAADLEPTDPAQLRPLYPREPEAVTKWRERHEG
ncbi:MAG: hypothetical protein SFY69_08160 [Planctomycetota bacterium]|nr:hypothetical protein [Planctomycetota bacterium]